MERTIQSLQAMSQSDWRCLVVNNRHPDRDEQIAVERVLQHLDGSRFLVHHESQNIGYAGAVNMLLSLSTTEYVAYLDHDVLLETPGWDEQLASLLDRFHEIGMLFPAGGAAPIDRGPYAEILWGVGCAWMVTRMAAQDALNHAAAGRITEHGSFRNAYFDEQLGHQEEVDFQTRIRLCGYKIASLPSVRIAHMATATSNPANTERISRGVVKWVDKWNAYFCGRDKNYHSVNVLRHEDWPPSALHMEEFYKQILPTLNENPDVIVINGTEYDLIKVPRLKGFYRHRIV